MASTHAKKKVRRSTSSHPAASKRRLLAPAVAAVGSPTLRVVANPASLEGRIESLEKAMAELRKDHQRALGLVDTLIAAGARMTAQANAVHRPRVEAALPSDPGAETSVDVRAEDLGGESA